MKLRLKLLVLALSTSVVAFGMGACLFRFLGDAVGDQVIFNSIG